MPELCIAFDVMGSDNGPEEVILGLELALRRFPNLPKVILVGQEPVISAILEKYEILSHPNISIKHASEVIEMEEKPVQSLRQKKDASMVRSIELVKEGTAQAALSCGNTGSLMACGTLKLRPLPGVERPALSSIIPSKNHHFVLIDAGANPETEPQQLAHNAILGCHHCKTNLGTERPAVGLLTIGTEEGKGTETIQIAHEYLKSLGSLIHYKGLIEGFHVFEEDIDVVVCDGFVGNILIKTCESLLNMLKKGVSEELKKSLVRKIGAGLSRGAYKAVQEQFNPDRYGGAPLLGLNGLVFKAHGSSNRYTIMNALHSLEKMLAQDMTENIERDILVANQCMKNVQMTSS